MIFSRSFLIVVVFRVAVQKKCIAISIVYVSLFLSLANQDHGEIKKFRAAAVCRQRIGAAVIQTFQKSKNTTTATHPEFVRDKTNRNTTLKSPPTRSVLFAPAPLPSLVL